MSAGEWIGMLGVGIGVTMWVALTVYEFCPKKTASTPPAKERRHDD